MRECAKMRCAAPAAAGVTVRYADREVLVQELRPERDPSVLDLCSEHVDNLVPPLGWSVEDIRSVSPVSQAG